MLKPTSFRLAPDTLARIKALALPGESASSVISRALIALEAARSAQDAPPAEGRDTSRLDALEARVAALEARSAPVVRDALHGQVERSATALQEERHGSVARATSPEDASQDKATGRATGSAGRSAHSKPDYPAEVRHLAVELADAGASLGEVRRQIAAVCGRAPDSKNIGRLIRGWRQKMQAPS